MGVEISHTGRQQVGAIQFVIADTIYVGGGEQVNMYAYNTTNNTWTQKADVPGVTQDRTFAVSFALNGKAFVGGGTDGSFHLGNVEMKDLWQYDVQANTWTQKNDLPSLFQLGTFVLNNKAYLVTAANGMPELYEYDETNDTWLARKGHPGVKLFNAFVFSIGNKGYVTCGNDSLANVTNTYEYDPVADKWNVKKSFTGAPREAGVAFVLNGKAYIGMGANYLFNTYYNDFFVFDPIADSWNTAATFPGDERAYGIAAVVNNKAYIGSGWKFDVSASYYTGWYQYTPASGTEMLQTETFDCYPNPATDFITVRLQGNQPSKYKLFNTIGQVVLSGIIVNKAELDVSSLQAGQYTLALESGPVQMSKVITVLGEQ